MFLQTPERIMNITIAIFEPMKLINKSIPLLLNLHEGFRVIVSSDNIKDFKQSMKSQTIPPDIILIDIHQIHNHSLEIIYWLSENFPESKLISIGSEAKYIQLFDVFTAGTKAYFSLEIEEIIFSRAIELVHQNIFESKQENFIDSKSFFLAKKFNGCNIVELNEIQRDVLEYINTLLTNNQIAVKLKMTESGVNYYINELGLLYSVNGRKGLKTVSSRLGYYSELIHSKSNIQHSK